MHYRQHASKAIRFLCFFVLMIGILELPRNGVVAARATKNEDSKPQISAQLLEKSIRFAIQQNEGTGSGGSIKGGTIARLESHDVQTLYEVAKAMNDAPHKDDELASIEIWHALAKSGHVLSQVALGFAYSENDKATAIAYFVEAGERGPHQAALYNAGRLLADPEIEDFVKSLAYLRAAYSLEDTSPKYATTHLTEKSRIAYEKLSEQLMALVKEGMLSKGGMLNIQQVADMFLYAELNDFPSNGSKAEKLWGKSMIMMNKKHWELAFLDLQKLETSYQEQLSELQVALLGALKQYCKTSIDKHGAFADEL